MTKPKLIYQVTHKQTPKNKAKDVVGEAYQGSCEEVLKDKNFQKKYKGKIDLIFFSPPFALNNKKSYGNTEGEEYINWLSSYGKLFTSYLSAKGSIVIELGNSWEAKKPYQSTVPMEALLEFKKNSNLKLCEEFIYYNSGKLPGPAEYVTKQRSRVTDAFSRIWWLAKEGKGILPNDYADNKKVLKPYSKRMEQLLTKQYYNSGKRPSGHAIGTKSFLKRNKGAIPRNVLDLNDKVKLTINKSLSDKVFTMGNNSSNGEYERLCIENNFKIHDARMPVRLAEFFISFCTNKYKPNAKANSCMVMDPFAGSATTGQAAQFCDRKWVTIEQDEDYAKSSEFRFHHNPQLIIKK